MRMEVGTEKPFNQITILRRDTTTSAARLPSQVSDVDVVCVVVFSAGPHDETPWNSERCIFRVLETLEIRSGRKL